MSTNGDEETNTVTTTKPATKGRAKAAAPAAAVINDRPKRERKPVTRVCFEGVVTVSSLRSRLL
jgi:hypothetical protein